MKGRPVFKFLAQTTPDAGTALGKTSTIALFGGSGTSIMLGLNTDQWQTLGVIGGLALGIAGFLVNLLFKYLHYRLAKRRAERKSEANESSWPVEA